MDIDEVVSACKAGERQLLERERDEARNAAYLLAHAYIHDSRPPNTIVQQALCYGPQKLTGTTPFWKSVSELAAMREHIPEERRALSAVRNIRPEQRRRGKR